MDFCPLDVAMTVACRLGLIAPRVLFLFDVVFFSHFLLYLLLVFVECWVLCADHSMVFYLATVNPGRLFLALVDTFIPIGIAIKLQMLSLSLFPSLVLLSIYLLQLPMAPKTPSKTPSKSSSLTKMPRCVLCTDFRLFWLCVLSSTQHSKKTIEALVQEVHFPHMFTLV